MDEVCEIFECKKTSVKRWIDRYEKIGSITAGSLLNDTFLEQSLF